MTLITKFILGVVPSEQVQPKALNIQSSLIQSRYKIYHCFIKLKLIYGITLLVVTKLLKALIVTCEHGVLWGESA